MPGTLIADRYRLVRPLGAGSSATVWEASDTALDRTVALKLLHRFALADPTERERLRREARALARLAHPRITIVFDYLEQTQPDGTPPQPVLVTELLNGSTLADRLRSGPLPAPEAVAVCAQLADALRAAHQAGIVHRDVKPANVVLTRGGVKLLDFGIAQASTDSNLTGNLAIGTPACMAPEQLTGRGATPASDVYALGCVMYWCLTGRPPYETSDINLVAHSQVYAPPPPINQPGLPPGVTEVYLQCMSKDPALRPTATEVFARLAQVAALAVPAAHQTMVMPAFDMPPSQQTQLVRPPLPPGSRGAGRGGGKSGGRAAPPRTTSGFRILIGMLLIAAVASGVAGVMLMKTGATGNTTTRPPAAATTAAATTPAASPSPSPSPSPSTVGNFGDPANDPIGYLEAMRAQITGFIAQGQDTLDPNTGADLQNSLADLENSVTSAQNNGNTRQQLRAVRTKINGVEQKINDDFNNGNISQDAGNQLLTELQNLSDNLGGNQGANQGGN